MWSIFQVLCNVQFISRDITVNPVCINGIAVELEIGGICGGETSDEWNYEVCLNCVHSCGCYFISIGIGCLDVGGDGSIGEWVHSEHSSHILLLI